MTANQWRQFSANDAALFPNCSRSIDCSCSPQSAICLPLKTIPCNYLKLLFLALRKKELACVQQITPLEWNILMYAVIQSS